MPVTVGSDGSHDLFYPTRQKTKEGNGALDPTRLRKFPGYHELANCRSGAACHPLFPEENRSDTMSWQKTRLYHELTFSGDSRLGRDRRSGGHFAVIGGGAQEEFGKRLALPLPRRRGSFGEE